MPRFGRLALIQPRVGIGDMVWHLPHLRALAAHADGPTVLVARPRSLAAQLVGPADGIASILMVERGQWSPGGRHEGVAGLRRLVSDFRDLRCDTAVLLTRSRTLAWAAAAAGIARRHGYGLSGTRLVMRPPFLADAAQGDHPHRQATAWLDLAGIALPSAEPSIVVSEADRVAARRRFGPADARPVAVGIAASDAWKQWGEARFAALIVRLLEHGWTEFALVGGEAERTLAEAIVRDLAPTGARITPVLGWDLRALAALLTSSPFYVGNDTAALNIAAAVGTRSYGLFGATPVLRHSGRIVAIEPPGGQDQHSGMSRITPDAVLSSIIGDRGG